SLVEISVVVPLRSPLSEPQLVGVRPMVLQTTPARDVVFCWALELSVWLPPKISVMVIGFAVKPVAPLSESGTVMVAPAVVFEPAPAVLLIGPLVPVTAPVHETVLFSST